MQSSKFYTIFIVIALLLGSSFSKHASSSPSKTQTILSSQVNLTGSCHAVDGLQDHTCTPGAIDKGITQNNIKRTICMGGYTQTVRPPVNYTNPLKLKMMQRYGYTDAAPNYELDHLISLELGGDPKSEQNLWPEPYNSTPGARDKDKVENYLHQQVCNGTMTLQEAQKEISTDWVSVYKKITQTK